MEGLWTNLTLMFNSSKFEDMIHGAQHDHDRKFDLLIDRLDRIITLLKTQSDSLQIVINKENKLMATIQDINTAVSAQSTVEDSIITLLNGINQQLKDAIASQDPAALDAVVANITANTTKLSDAVTANTPVVPVTPTVPVVTPVA